MSRKTHLLLQLCLVVIWISILWADGTITVSSQTPGCPQPPYWYTNPLRRFLEAKFGTVKVQIDSRFNTQYPWAPDAKARIKAGHEKWNGVVCSGVTFTDFSGKDFTTTELIDEAPFAHVYWVLGEPPVSSWNADALAYFDADDRVKAVKVTVRPDFVAPRDPIYFNYLGTHEIGHSFNLNNCTAACIPVSMMGGFTLGPEDLAGPRSCDIQNVKALYCPSPSPSPSPSPTPAPENPNDCQSSNWFWNFQSGGCFPEPQTCDQRCAPYFSPDGGACESPVDYCGFQWGCGFGFTDGGSGCCCLPTPILVDVAGNGLSLTNAYDGVNFDMGGDGHKEPIAWTTSGTDDAWLVLDRNNNGTIDSAKEMFGNVTDQPSATTERHGFIALAEFDKPENGGNSDGKITKTDSVFGSLRLWQDVNKNGISEPSELRTLNQLGLKTVELNYQESRRTDEHGNQFKYRAKVRDGNDVQMGRWAWDVILKVNPPPRP